MKKRCKININPLVLLIGCLIECGRKGKDMENKKRLLMKPGRTNQEDRDNFIKFWVERMNSCSDEEWSREQNILINSNLINVDHKTYLKVKGLHRTIS